MIKKIIARKNVMLKDEMFILKIFGTLAFYYYIFLTL